MHTKKCSANEHKPDHKNWVQGLIKLGWFSFIREMQFSTMMSLRASALCNTTWAQRRTLALFTFKSISWREWNRRVDPSEWFHLQSENSSLLFNSKVRLWLLYILIDCEELLKNEFDYKTIMIRHCPNWWLYCFVKSSRILDCAILASSGSFRGGNKW